MSAGGESHDGRRVMHVDHHFGAAGRAGLSERWKARPGHSQQGFGTSVQRPQAVHSRRPVSWLSGVWFCLMNDVDAESSLLVFLPCASAIDRTVLAAGATKADRKMHEPALSKA